MVAEKLPKRAKEWTVRQRKFMLWLALPEDARVPLNQRLYAEEIGVNEATLSDWKATPGFMAEVQDIIRASLSDAAHDVMGAFKAEAKKGSFPHQKMFFEMLGWHVDKQELGGDVLLKILRGASMDEL